MSRTWVLLKLLMQRLMIRASRMLNRHRLVFHVTVGPPIPVPQLLAAPGSGGNNASPLKECPPQTREFFAKLRASTWESIPSPGPPEKCLSLGGQGHTMPAGYGASCRGNAAGRWPLLPCGRGLGRGTRARRPAPRGREDEELHTARGSERKRQSFPRCSRNMHTSALD